MAESIRINGRVYCPTCVEEYGLDQSNPQGTDFVEQTVIPYRLMLKCSFPGCQRQVKPYAKKWITPASEDFQILL